MALVITRKGKKRLKELLTKEDSLTTKEKNLGSFLDYIKTWGPIDEENDPFLNKEEIPDGETTAVFTKALLKQLLEAKYVDKIE